MIRLSKRVHCIGIGGAGMAPLAELLLSRGCAVSGSDRARSRQTERMESRGIQIQYGHEPSLVKEAELLVYSSAIAPHNAERRYASEHRIRQVRRAEVLGDLMRHAFSIGVAGTHGKTTTTAMVGHILTVARLRPTLLVGGEMASAASNDAVGGDELMVTEADEYDRSFLALHPTVAVVTNIEEDHLDCYAGIEDIRRTFAEYVSHVPFYGVVVLGLDSPEVRDVASSARAEVITCGMSVEADYRAVAETIGHGQTAVAVIHNGERVGTFKLTLLGAHNVRNALCAAVAAMRDRKSVV
jgi:UDP-N-acetylmuramate--alanine ligase